MFFFVTGVLSKINDVSTYQNSGCFMYFEKTWNIFFLPNLCIFLSFLSIMTYNSDIDSFGQVLAFRNLAGILPVKKRHQFCQHSNWRNSSKSLFLIFSLRWICYQFLFSVMHGNHFGHLVLKLANCLILNAVCQTFL